MKDQRVEQTLRDASKDGSKRDLGTLGKALLSMMYQSKLHGSM